MDWRPAVAENRLHPPLTKTMLPLPRAACAAAFKPCHMPYTPCFATVSPPPFLMASACASTTRRWTMARRSSPPKSSAALQPWQDGLEVSVNHLFEYFTGNGNADGADLTAYLTAPLMFRPARSNQPWYAEMVLKPSASASAEAFGGGGKDNTGRCLRGATNVSEPRPHF